MFPLLAALVLGQSATNPLYQDFLERGLLVGADVRVKLPAPTLPDGLAPAAQTAAIKAIVGADYSWDEFTRKSVVAPHILRIRDEKPVDTMTPTRGVDVWFILYGDLAATDDDKFLNRLLVSGKEGGGTSKDITPADLAKRKITLQDEKREKYGNAEFDVLDRVRLRVTGRAVVTKKPESVLIAAEIDPRFRSDPEFPDEWRPLTKNAGGLVAGAPQPYTGAGMYLKITKLAEPAGALFVEQHIVFAEPTGWFDGANLLRSKLPPAVQSTVRSMRREWAKTGK